MKHTSKNQPINQLIDLLADGRFHSGEQLGAAMGMSRAAVWKHIKSLADFGLDVQSIKGKGYRLPEKLGLLNQSAIYQALNAEALAVISAPIIFKQIESTNQYLLDLADVSKGEHGMVCLAEQQTAGRGRRGREWVSPFGQNIYCSLLWRFEKGMPALEGLSLVVALSIVKALERHGVNGIGLKWPNDILANGKKLAGILIEVRGDLVDYCDVVIGFGINVNMSKQAAQNIDQAWTDLNTLHHEVLDRNAIISSVLNQLAVDLVCFATEGFEVFRSHWNKRDSFANKTVVISAGSQSTEGVSQGVNSQGALLLSVEGKVESFFGGEISLREKVS